MGKNNIIEKIGVVTQALPNTMFRVKLEDEDREIIAHLSGKMRMYRISIMPGDFVRLEMTPYDINKGRIVYRLQNKPKHLKQTADNSNNDSNNNNNDN